MTPNMVQSQFAGFVKLDMGRVRRRTSRKTRLMMSAVRTSFQWLPQSAQELNNSSKSRSPAGDGPKTGPPPLAAQRANTRRASRRPPRVPIRQSFPRRASGRPECGTRIQRSGQDVFRRSCRAKKRVPSPQLPWLRPVLPNNPGRLGVQRALRYRAADCPHRFEYFLPYSVTGACCDLLQPRSLSGRQAEAISARSALKILEQRLAESGT
jgi:hypothetical protein